MHEAANSWKFKLFYPIRRLAQKLKKVWATVGDLKYLCYGKMCRAKTEKDRQIYLNVSKVSVLPTIYGVWRKLRRVYR
ncbi:TDP-N-acetylfucosamine:lipid II N-acetylfucosaminyltransferase [Mannheimia granulomatis]|uniref:TDP-N-acetylfucosamine:lipid II N-acetylfucosaminyltransferase n=1 Tax=Mannheimia granulomatis TaxID=85402 RepID=UPI001F32FF46